jgi:tripartite-type tricarboxylate transporter receptor subunit TctC
MTRIPRRAFLHLAASVVAIPTVSSVAFGQSYPSQPVRIVVGFPPGATADIIARLIGRWLSTRLGQSIIVENRPGASGNIGTAAVVRAPADGSTLLLVTAANAINASLYDNLGFNFTRDVTPVASISRNPFVMEVHPSVPANTILEFIAYAKANPGKITMASAGHGTPHHLCGELFSAMNGVRCSTCLIAARRRH